MSFEENSNENGFLDRLPLSRLEDLLPQLGQKFSFPVKL